MVGKMGKERVKWKWRKRVNVGEEDGRGEEEHSDGVRADEKRGR